MAVYILRIQQRTKHNVITLPKSWRNKQVSPDERYVFAVELANGNLEIFSERSFYGQKFGEFGLNQDIGAGEVDQGQDRPTGDNGTVRELEEIGSVAADTGENGVELLQDRSGS